MVIYVKNLNESTKLLELISKLSIHTKYVVNIQKSIVFPYTSNEQLEKEIFKTPFTVASKPIKFLEINLTKDV